MFKVRPESLIAAESLLNGGNAPRHYMSAVTVDKRKAKAGTAELA